MPSCLLPLLLLHLLPLCLCEWTDYCSLLGEDDIQGKKTGFLAGNSVYYIGGIAYSQRVAENETIGLTHPFHNDLRSRGTGIAYYEGVGTGNDFYGWEFHHNTRVAYGRVVMHKPYFRWETPAPTRMFWQPDKMIVEYELSSSSPFIQGEFKGWCKDWSKAPGDSFWVDLDKAECWSHCDADSRCFQAVFEDESASGGGNQCWVGLNRMTSPPSGDRCPTCEDTCYAKPVPEPVASVNIREEKFIAANDVVSTIITADRPVTLEISGHSYSSDRHVISLNGRCSVDVGSNSIHVVEGGRVVAKVMENPEVEQEAALMYDGMSSVLSASRPLENVTLYEVSPGVCGYTFSVDLDSQGTTLSWAMDDDSDTAVEAVEEVLEDPVRFMTEKTSKMNDLLNNVVPYFRCSDDDIVKIYYFLWSINLMYYTQGNSGMQTQPHTQTAVNNFLGMHRYDAVFQILVGSWASPEHHEFFANGNVLCWADVMPYRSESRLPDNFGIDWVSGVYGYEVIGHVLGAWHIFEHSGNLTSLEKSYEFYKELFWDGIGGKLFGYAYDSVLCLNKMAEVLGYPEDPAHWNASIGMENVQKWLDQNWEMDTPGMFGLTETPNRMGWNNIAPAGMSMFPRDWAETMATVWMDNPVEGFFGPVPLTTIALKDFPDQNIVNSFAVAPVANWYMIRGLYLHTVDALANKFTLAHLKKYNMEWGMPVAPEARHKDWTMFGDQYSNFNAGKILLILEGIGGLRYSTLEDSFTFADNLPQDWSFMEFRLPVQKEGEAVTWVKARAERRQEGGITVKTVRVENNPFTSLLLQPWTEDSEVLEVNNRDMIADAPEGHMGWRFNTRNASLSLTLKAV